MTSGSPLQPASALETNKLSFDTNKIGPIYGVVDLASHIAILLPVSPCLWKRLAIAAAPRSLGPN